MAYVHINRLFDFAGAADKHVLHIHVDADGAVPVGVISRRRAVVRRAAITGNQHEHGAQKANTDFFITSKPLTCAYIKPASYSRNTRLLCYVYINISNLNSIYLLLFNFHV